MLCGDAVEGADYRVMTDLPNVLNVLVIANVPDAALEKVREVDRKRLNVVGAFAEFYDEILEDNPGLRARRWGTPPPPAMTPAEREATLAAAHVIMLPFPLPKGLLPRAKSAMLFHCPFAGVSNLRGLPYWGAPTMFTSARGYTNALPIAEVAVSASVMLIKGLHIASANTIAGRFAVADYPLMRNIAGKTMGVVGLGGIGGHAARLARGLGMRTVATRHSATERREGVDGVDVLYPPSELHAMLAESDVVVVAAMWTDETEGLMDAAAFAAMKDGAMLVNVARGEIVNEPALIDALNSGKLSGAYLDVFKDDFAAPPSEELATAKNIVITPHTSGSSDAPHHFAIDVLCANLRRLLDGEPLENVIDWERGY